MGSPALTIDTYVSMVLSGINLAFARLFRAIRQITYVLLTLLPLSTLQQIVRLACLIHAASVRSEPGSNSHYENLNPVDKNEIVLLVLLITGVSHYENFKDQIKKIQKYFKCAVNI